MSEPFEPREPRRFVGRYQPRIDGPEKASGRAEYLDDIALGARFPGMLHARVLRSPFPHARIIRMDTSRAEALPGVHCVLTYDDPEVRALKPTTNAWTSMNTAGYEQMYWPSLRDRRVLSDHVTWIGDEAGAVVAAETEAIAEEALRLIEVEWEALPFALGREDALADEAPLIHPEINAENNLFPNAEDTQEDVFHEVGDVEAGFAKADVILDLSSRHHRADHSALDTRGCLVTWPGDRLTCWTNVYQADQTRMHIAEMLDLPLNKVRVLCPYIGGSFGRSNVGDQTFYIFTALLAKRTGRAVRFKYTRREDFHDTRNAIDYRVRVGATKDGRITAMETHSIGDAGGYAEHTMAAVKMVLELDAMEVLLPHIPAIRMIGHSVYTNTIPGGCMRGIGNSQLNMALGLVVDALAEELGLDPIDVAVKNFSHEWEEPPNRSLSAVLRAGAERVGWERRRPAGKGAAPEAAGRGDAVEDAAVAAGGCGVAPAKRRGIGFSFHHSWHAGWQELIRGRVQVGIRLNPDMSVILQAPQAETGVGSNTCAVLGCAEVLDFLEVTPADIEWINPADTQTGLKDMVQTDSSVSYLQAEIMRPAADDLRRQLRTMGARHLEVAEEDVEIAGGRYLVKGEDTGTSVREVMQAGDMVPLQATVTGEMPAEKTGAPYLAAFAEVEVDTETGRVDVLKLAIVHDAGTVMFPSGAEAQQIGGQVQGIGEALYEEVVYDRDTGTPLSFDWIDYTVPTMLDMPQVDPVLLEVWRGAGEYGACGVGESALCCTPRAILNAIHNAVDVRINHIPVKPQTVLEALARKEAGRPGLDAELHEEISRCLDTAMARSQVAAERKAAGAEAPAETQDGAGELAGARARGDDAAGPAAAGVTPAPADHTAASSAPADLDGGAGHAPLVPPPSYRRAASFDEAVALLADGDGGARALAGGTDLLGIVKDRVRREAPTALIDIKTAGGDGVAEDDGELVVGALTSIAELERDPLVRERCPALAEAAHAVASPQLRTMGTVGGNLCQEPRCWYYRSPGNAFDCTRKGGAYCNALTGENRYHSIFGSMKVDVRPCTDACPGSVEIPEYMELLRAGEVDGAARRLLERNPLPAVTGRVCPHTCMDACNRGTYDEAVAVRDVERFLGDHVLAHPGLAGAPSAAGRAAQATGSVAIVGSGPAGLAAAYYLRRRGHRVVVLERREKAGGMLRYGIPEYRLPKDVLDRQLAVLEGLGVELRCGVTLGDDGDAYGGSRDPAGESVTLDELRREYDAVFVATGAWDTPPIGLENEELLRSGLEFLTSVAAGERRAPGPRLLVIGGGNVAVDVAVTARRLGADKVTVACLESCEEMPALPDEVDEALAEGIELVPSCGPSRLLLEGERVTGLEMVRCTSVFDDQACFAPTFDEADRSVIEADEVILAVGQRLQADALASAGLELDGGRLAADQQTQRTPLDGVLAGGDAVTGPATVIAALAAGRRAAETIMNELEGDEAGAGDDDARGAPEGTEPGVPAGMGESVDGRAGLQRFDPSCLDRSPSCRVAPVPPEDRRLDGEDGVTVEAREAACEAARCFDCGCVAACPSDLAPMLVALDAVVETTAREVPAEAFFAASSGGSTVLGPGELIRSVRLPARGDGWRAAYEKFRLRRSIDFPILSAAVAVRLDGDAVAEARIVLGAAAPVPLRMQAAEEALVGMTIDELLDGGGAPRVAVSALEGALPLTRNAYKVTVAQTLIARTLRRLAAG